MGIAVTISRALGRAGTPQPAVKIPDTAPVLRRTTPFLNSPKNSVAPFTRPSPPDASFSTPPRPAPQGFQAPPSGVDGRYRAGSPTGRAAANGATRVEQLRQQKISDVKAQAAKNAARRIELPNSLTGRGGVNPSNFASPVGRTNVDPLPTGSPIGPKGNTRSPALKMPASVPSAAGTAKSAGRGALGAAPAILPDAVKNYARRGNPFDPGSNPNEAPLLLPDYPAALERAKRDLERLADKAKKELDKAKEAWRKLFPPKKNPPDPPPVIPPEDTTERKGPPQGTPGNLYTVYYTASINGAPWSSWYTTDVAAPWVTFRIEDGPNAAEGIIDATGRKTNWVSGGINGKFPNSKVNAAPTKSMRQGDWVEEPILPAVDPQDRPDYGAYPVPPGTPSPALPRPNPGDPAPLSPPSPGVAPPPLLPSPAPVTPPNPRPNPGPAPNPPPVPGTPGNPSPNATAPGFPSPTNTPITFKRPDPGQQLDIDPNTGRQTEKKPETDPFKTPLQGPEEMCKDPCMAGIQQAQAAQGSDIDGLKEGLEAIKKHLGVGELPATLKLITGEFPQTINNMCDLGLYGVRNLDAVSGKFPMKIRVKKPDGTEPEITLENESHALQEMFAALLSVAEDADAAVNIGARLAVETTSARIALQQGNAITTAIQKYLGFDMKPKPDKIKLGFTPSATGANNTLENDEMEAFLKPSEQNFVSSELAEKVTLKGILERMLNGVEIVRAAHWHPVKYKPGQDSNITGDAISASKQKASKGDQVTWNILLDTLKKAGFDVDEKDPPKIETRKGK